MFFAGFLYRHFKEAVRIWGGVSCSSGGSKHAAARGQTSQAAGGCQQAVAHSEQMPLGTVRSMLNCLCFKVVFPFGVICFPPEMPYCFLY